MEKRSIAMGVFLALFMVQTLFAFSCDSTPKEGVSKILNCGDCGDKK